MSKYIVFDLEMCKVPKGEKREIFRTSRELIQIGAVELDESYKITRTFMTYVKPEFGSLDPFVSQLTQITDQHLQSAPLAEVALKDFLDWIPEDAILVAWSENDVNQIDDELYFKDIDLPEFFDYLDHYIDCQELFAEKMNCDKQYNLQEALLICNIDYDSNVHDALSDAHNTALLFAKIQKEDTLELSPYFITQEKFAAYLDQYGF